jgi:hydroxymethylpyrimidine pyrophosphatase-like HAD family hydrolase
MNKDFSSFRAAAFDLDDTLLRDDLSISPYTVDVFRRLNSRGFLLIPASGRSEKSLLPFVNRLGCIRLYIACNGAEIYGGSTRKCLRAVTFPASIALEIADFGVEYGCYAQTYAGDKFYFNQHSAWAERYAAASMLTGEYVGDLRSFIREPRSKILMMADAVEARSRSLNEFTEEAISDAVNKMIDAQIADGQFAETPLSFKDVEDIRRVFTARLVAMNHHRISYPTLNNNRS